MFEDDSLKNLILPKSRLSIEEKEEILSPQERSIESPDGLSLKELKIALYIMLLVLILCVPKVYLSNTIYYLSKDISTLQTQHDMLLEENKRLKHEIQELRYKILILNEF
ncbi:hypothetical protein [Helicobacter marmotae]|uniref:Septum formation initiator n=1 Tax=Helicobacter marmotae TaxID=152490 RepID=A0A3D8I2W3_9HELI|nr:hypothetical protein [Helicobacter marmotae]RDU59316.1 hypothetical protein CQA63_07210 [Helicobacter marmotae]